MTKDQTTPNYSFHKDQATITSSDKAWGEIGTLNSKVSTYCRGSMSPFSGDNACKILKDGIDSHKELSELYNRGFIRIVCESEYYAPRIEVI